MQLRLARWSLCLLLVIVPGAISFWMAVSALTFLLAAQPLVSAAPKPLYRDPVYDGAADPAVIWNPQIQRWWMFYTNRRAKVPGLSGVAWVHGTRIGIAESTDRGRTWQHVGTAEIDLPPEIGGAEPTHWAPEVFTAPDGIHHMLLTVVPGIFENWNHPRTIVHLTSRDLRKWSAPRPLKLASDRVIDACILRLSDGSWRLWYNNERDNKSIYFADSPDLLEWKERGKAVGDQAGEGPKVFRWRDAYWMVTDVWAGLAVYRSDDTFNWTRQAGNLLEQPGRGADDQVKGGHPDVVVRGGRAFIFYFTHPGRRGPDVSKDTYEQRRSSIQVAELVLENGRLTCDRDAAVEVDLGVGAESGSRSFSVGENRLPQRNLSFGPLFRKTESWTSGLDRARQVVQPVSREKPKIQASGFWAASLRPLLSQ